MHEKVPKYANIRKFRKNFLKYAKFSKNMQFFDFYCIFDWQFLPKKSRKYAKICKIKLLLKYSKYHKNTIYIPENKQKIAFS